MTLWPPNIDTSPATWQRRTLRYLAIYLVLALALVALREVTQHVRPALRDAQTQEAKLLTQRDELEIAVQVATTPQKVQAWAEANGMQRFAEARKTTANLSGAAATPGTTPAQPSQPQPSQPGSGGAPPNTDPATADSAAAMPPNSADNSAPRPVLEVKTRWK